MSNDPMSEKYIQATDEVVGENHATKPDTLNEAIKALVSRLDVEHEVDDDQMPHKQINSVVTTGTAPFVIASTTKVTNLNADMVDGVHGVPQEAVTVGLSGNQYVNADGITYDLVPLVDTATRCFDQNGNWTNAPTHKYTVPATGYYRVSYHNQQGAAGQDGLMRMKVYLNGAALNETQTSAHTGLSCGMSIILSLTLNSYIQLYAVYSDAVGNNLYAGFCTMSIERIK